MLGSVCLNGGIFSGPPDVRKKQVYSGLHTESVTLCTEKILSARIKARRQAGVVPVFSALHAQHLKPSQSTHITMQLSVLKVIFPGEPGWSVLLQQRTMEVVLTTADV